MLFLNSMNFYLKSFFLVLTFFFLFLGFVFFSFLLFSGKLADVVLGYDTIKEYTVNLLFSFELLPSLMF